MMRKILIGSVMLLGLSSMAFAKTSQESLDGIVAIVNDSVITQSELDDSISTVKKQLASSNTSAPTPADIRKHVLDQLIDRKLALQLAEAGGLKITDDQVEKAIANIASQNKVPVKDLYEKVGETGLTAEAYRKEIREEMLIQQVQQHEVGSHLTITEQEVDDFMRSATWKAYNNREYHLEDILIALPATPSSQDVANAKKQADTVLAKIHGGMSFSALAAADSGNNQALQGGDLGWLRLPQIPPAFANELVHMKPADILGPISTPNGFHIVRLVAMRELPPQGNASQQRQQVQQLIYQRKMAEGLQAWSTKIRSEAFINMHPET
ncbi:MAG: SurA N-terminal domain-containing protein [Pseudomonadota bacterium]